MARMDISKLTIEQAQQLADDLKAKLAMVKRAMPNGQNGPAPQHDYALFDWSKSDAELSYEHNIGPATVRKHRYLLGHARVKKTKWYPACNRS